MSEVNRQRVLHGRAVHVDAGTPQTCSRTQGAMAELLHAKQGAQKLVARRPGDLVTSATITRFECAMLCIAMNMDKAAALELNAVSGERSTPGRTEYTLHKTEVV